MREWTDPETGLTRRYPTTSTEAYLLKELCKDRPFPSDTFFVCVTPVDGMPAFPQRWQGVGKDSFSYGCNIHLMLSEDKVAIHPDLLKKPEGKPWDIEEARERRALYNYLQLPENVLRYPTYTQVRLQQDHGAGVYILAQAAFVFTGPEGEAAQMILNIRTGESNAYRWQSVGGMVDDYDNGKRELAEEITFHATNHNTGKSVFGVPLPHLFSHREALHIKQQQLPKLLEECTRLGLPRTDAVQLLFPERVRIDDLGVQGTVILLEGTLDGKAKRMTPMPGFCGFESAPTHTFGCFESGYILSHESLCAQLFGEDTSPNDVTITLVDGEFGRTVKAWKEQDLRASMENDPNHSLCGISALVKEIKRWPFLLKRNPDPRTGPQPGASDHNI